MSSTIQPVVPKPTGDLGWWVSQLEYEDIPPDVREHAKLCLLDGVGVGLFGSAQPWGKITSQVVDSLSGSGPSTVWGTAVSCAPTDAALANGTALHGFELDDAHMRSPIHPGSVTIPAGFALAEARHLSGKAFLTAMVAGYEVGLRVGIAMGAGSGTFHANGTVGCVAAAATAAKCLNLDAERATHALAIGADQAGGLYVARMGAMTKRMHAGRADQSGVLAALLAECDFTGSPDALESPDGGFMQAFAADPNLDELTSGLGCVWEIVKVGFKVYASCATTHTTIDAIDRLQKRGLRQQDLAQLTIKMSNRAMHVNWPYKPSGVVGAQMNGYYVAAVKLLDGEVFIDQFREERLADPHILDLIGRIAIVHDPQLDGGGMATRHGVIVEARLKDGQVWSERVDYRRGSAERPVSRAEIASKFSITAGKVLSKPALDILAERLLSIEQAPDMARVGELLRKDQE